MYLSNMYLPIERLDLFLLSIVNRGKKKQNKVHYLEIIVRSLQLFW